ncbi:hypothetical protein B0T18DRAFT_452966 [Schizothecium vesticola]|uniref:Uncharacterized protein n=1 Tax=Schizothecium vesticola TaxID=314040 RepID=A0AA40FAH9_9PEZI|nr:hypothetical protein B0T18DRAFT_452966 [Schizothecium vesticola]
MSAFKPLKTKSAVGGGPSDLSSHHPKSFASRMAQITLDQEKQKVIQPSSSNVGQEAAKSVDNKAPLNPNFDTKVSDKGPRQFAASSDAADRSKGGRRDCHVDLSDHHPLSFASRKAMMDANREDTPERQASKASSHRGVVIPKPCPSATVPQDPLSNVDVEPRPQVDDGEVRQFRNPIPIRLPASVVLAASRSFAGMVSDARSVVKFVDFDDLPDLIGFVAERCEVSDDDEIDQGYRATKSDTSLRVQGLGLRRTSRGKPARPSSQIWSGIREGERAKRTDGKGGGTVDGREGSGQSVEFGFIPMVLVAEAGSQLAMELSEENYGLETANLSIRLEMCDIGTTAGHQACLSFSQQAMNSDRMINTQHDTTPPATKRSESTVWSVAWLAFLLSIIPVVVLTLSFLAVAGCTSASPGIPDIYLYSLDTVSGGTSLRIGYAGICAVRADSQTTCTTTNAWSSPEGVSAALFQSVPSLQAMKVVISTQSNQVSDHIGDTTVVLIENACASIGGEQSEPTTVTSFSPYCSSVTSTATADSAYFSSSSPESTTTSATTTQPPVLQTLLTLSSPESMSSWSAPPSQENQLTVLPVLTAASPAILPILPTTPPSPPPSSDVGTPREDPSPPPASPDFGLGFDPVQAATLALAYQRAEPPFCVLTIVFFVLALVQFALLRALPHHLPCLRPFVARNKRGIRFVAWILMLVALLMGGLGTEWACWYASRAGSVVEVDPSIGEGGHSARDVEQRFEMRYGGSRALFLLQLFAEMAMLLPVVCTLITTVGVWVLKVQAERGDVEKARNVETGADQEMDNLRLAEEGRSRERREAEEQEGLDDCPSSDSELSRYLQAPPRQSEKCSVISVSLSETHNPEETSAPGQPEPSQPVAAVTHDSTTPVRIHRAWTGTTNSLRFSASQYTCSNFSAPEDTHWCDASPVHVTKGAKMVDITSPRQRGGGGDKGGQNSDNGAGRGSEK